MRGVALALIASLALGVPAGAAPPEESVALSGPQAKYYGYATPVLAVAKGGELSYSNIDLERHNVVHDAMADGVAGPSKRPWCRGFHRKHCPIFWSPLIGLGATTEVKGLEGITPGERYTFFCTLHPGMRGILVATEPG